MLEEDAPLQPAASLGGTGPATENLLTFDSHLLREYLEQLLPLILGADVADLENTIFAYPDTLEKIKRFANDAQAPVLFILKERIGGSDEGKKMSNLNRCLAWPDMFL